MKAGINKDILTMKRTFLYILGALFIMSSCVEENFKGNFSKVEGEVSFRASVSKTPATKTVYGNLNEDGSKQEVFWTHNDQITVFGANCYIPQADYAVSVSSVDAEGNTVINKTQNYASALNKTGSYGVQWGNVAQTDFYAVYPATSGTFEADGTEVTEKTTAEGEIVSVVKTSKATVTTNISTTQKVYFTQTVVGQNADGSNKLGWKGVHYSDDIHNPSANGALMYACTSAATTDKEQVDLQFHPFSTVLRFNFEGFRVVADTDNPNIPDYSASVYVEQIKLTAPTNAGVAGNFDLTINNDGTETSSPTATATKGDSDVITIVPSDYIPLATHETLEFDVFAIPQKYTMSETALWTVTLETTGGNYTYKMIPKVVNNGVATSTTATLTAGKIHNLGIPMLTVEKSQAVDIPDDSWIAYIPRNVYLSELSVPGAWYSTNSAYQGNIGLESDENEDNIDDGLASLYAAGVRAFHIDCRLTNKYQGTGYDLCCAGSEASSGGAIRSERTLVSDALLDIAQLLNPKEYVIVVLTIAEKPKTDSNNSLGTVDPEAVLTAIYDMLDTNKDDLKLYYKKTLEDDSIEYGINANTTVNDVLGHMIVKINMNTSPDNFTTYLSDYETHLAMISEGSLSSTEELPIIKGDFSKMNTASMYWGNTKVGIDADDTNPTMNYYYHQAQLTTDDRISDSNYTESVTSNTDGPLLATRINAINDIINQSYSIYKSAKHNAWFQISTGGTIKYEDKALISEADCEIHGKVASVLNSYLHTRIQEKIEQNILSPVGIVLMNYCVSSTVNDTYYRRVIFGQTVYSKSVTVDTYGPSLVEAILEMNKKFFLNRNPEAEEWPDGNPFDQVQNPTPQESAAYVTVKGEVF